MRTRTVLFFAPIAILLAREASAYDVKEVERAGSVTGRVTYQGPKLAPKKLSITKDETICGKGVREVDGVTVGKTGGVEGAVVYLEGVAGGKDWAAPPGDGYLIDQRGCRFLPSTRVIPKGAKVSVRNSDPTLHNINAQEVSGAVRTTLFNVAQPVKGAQDQLVKPRRGHAVKLECNVHDFMHEWVFVADNPYYAVTGPDGSFKLEGVPPGAHRLAVWHPVLGSQEVQIEVGAEGVITHAFTFGK